MKTVRLGLAGLGNIGRFHAESLLGGKVRRAELTAASDPHAPALADFKQIRTFERCEDMVRSGAIDALVVATPHFLHTSLGIDALRNGLHLMVEKPISAHKADAERLIAVHRERPRQVFAGMFQLRVEPRYLEIRRLLQNGETGRRVRVSWILTDWYRTEAYYAGSPWRATWKGEGGGVLLNQCLHQLDVLQWLCGMPARVRGFCRLGRFHDIEVEDDVTAHLEWADGATGVFLTSTGEAPGTNRLELCGTRGRLVLENDKLRFTRLEADMAEFSRTARTGFAKPEAREVEIPFGNAPAPHAALLQNFVDAILDGAPLIAPGAEGLGSVELANAILYSSLADRTVELPLDGAAWEKKLQELIAGSRRERAVAPSVAEDFKKSFKR